MLIDLQISKIIYNSVKYKFKQNHFDLLYFMTVTSSNIVVYAIMKVNIVVRIIIMQFLAPLL